MKTMRPKFEMLTRNKGGTFSPTMPPIFEIKWIYLDHEGTPPQLILTSIDCDRIHGKQLEYELIRERETFGLLVLNSPNASLKLEELLIDLYCDRYVWL